MRDSNLSTENKEKIERESPIPFDMEVENRSNAADYNDLQNIGKKEVRVAVYNTTLRCHGLTKAPLFILQKWLGAY